MADILKFPQLEKKPRIDHEAILNQFLADALSKIKYSDRQKLAKLTKNAYLQTGEKYSVSMTIMLDNNTKLEIRTVYDR